MMQPLSDLPTCNLFGAAWADRLDQAVAVGVDEVEGLRGPNHKHGTPISGRQQQLVARIEVLGHTQRAVCLAVLLDRLVVLGHPTDLELLRPQPNTWQPNGAGGDLLAPSNLPASHLFGGVYVTRRGGRRPFWRHARGTEEMMQPLSDRPASHLFGGVYVRPFGAMPAGLKR